MNLRTGFNRLSIVLGGAWVLFVAIVYAMDRSESLPMLTVVGAVGALGIAAITWTVGWIVRGFWSSGDRPA